MYQTKIGIAPIEHDKFIAASPFSHLLQSYKWHFIKENWGSELIGFFEDDKLVASVSVLIRPLPFGFTMLYIPRGLAVDYKNTELLKYIISELTRYGKSQKALFIKFDPALKNNFEDMMLVKKLRVLGCKWSGLTNDMHDTIQPRFNAVVYKKDFHEENFNKKEQQHLRKARNSHTIVKYGQIELLDDFAKIIHKTEERKGIKLRDKGYFKKMIETYQEAANITMVYLNLQELLLDAKAALAKAKSSLMNSQSKNEKKHKQLESDFAACQRTVKELGNLVIENGPIVPVSAALTVNFGKHTEHLYAGTDVRYKKYYTAYLAWFDSIQYMFDHGAETVNMGGLENSLDENDGLLKFKRNFKPVIEEYVGEFDIPVYKALYPLAHWLYQMKKAAF